MLDRMAFRFFRAKAIGLLKAPADACLESSSDGQRKVLEAVSGIGPVKANALSKAFGSKKALEMLRTKDERLLTVPGISPKMLDKLQIGAQDILGTKGRAALSL